MADADRNTIHEPAARPQFLSSLTAQYEILQAMLSDRLRMALNYGTREMKCIDEANVGWIPS